jgi:dihydrofolate reductase
MSKRINIIVAMDAARGIGVNNTLPWNLKEDLAHFKRTTMSAPIIMGRKTYDSIGRPLPGRDNIVVSRNRDIQIPGVKITTSIIGACMDAANSPHPEVFIIGGANIFEQSLDLADRIIVTKIHDIFHCDTFFPSIDMRTWIEKEKNDYTSESGISYSIHIYDKR